MNHRAQRYNTMSPIKTVITTITRKSVNSNYRSKPKCFFFLKKKKTIFIIDCFFETLLIFSFLLLLFVHFSFFKHLLFSFKL